VVSKGRSVVDTSVIWCGDNLEKLKHFPDGSVDLIYIDPPFNSNRNYEVFWGETKEKRSFEDRHASTQAYIEFMRPRCVELARVLKETGSFYYHCDWHASHYVKVMLDQIFGENLFQNEIVWKRTTAHSDTKQGAKNFGRVHDVLLVYTGGKKTWTFNTIYVPYTQDYIESHYRHVEPETGRRYRKDNLTANKPGGDTSYEWKLPDGRKTRPYEGRYWAYSREKMQEFEQQGRLIYTKSGMPEYKRYLDEMPGQLLQDVWDDIAPINSQAAERLGYPTQKPLALMDRIVTVSSSRDDIVLDAFCGCGTALVAAQRLGRKWIGIDISPTACRVMAKRLEKECGLREGTDFVVRDLPRSEKQLRSMPPFEFENWAVIALGGIPNKAQVGDMGIDGKIYPVSATPERKGVREGYLDFMDIWYPIQVKQKDKIGRPDIDSFEAVMSREDRTKGFFVGFDFSSDAMREIDAFFKKTGKSIIALTVREILDEEIARKLA
jgi:DNA modification methylase